MKLLKRLLVLITIGLLFLSSGCKQNTNPLTDTNEIALDGFGTNLYRLDFMELYQKVVDIAGTEELVWTPSYASYEGIDLYFKEDGTLVNKFDLSFVANNNSTPYNYFVKQYTISGQPEINTINKPIDSFSIHKGSGAGPFERDSGFYRHYGAYDTFKKFMQFLNNFDWLSFIDTYIKGSYEKEPDLYMFSSNRGFYDNEEYNQLCEENKIICYECLDMQNLQLLDTPPQTLQVDSYIRLSAVYIKHEGPNADSAYETTLANTVLFIFE